jgi:hypothetical protein
MGAKERNAQRKAELETRLSNLENRCEEHEDSLEWTRGTVEGLKRKVDWMARGSHLVVEGSERLEALWGLCTRIDFDGGFNYARLKAEAPAALAKEVAEALGLALGSSEPDSWTKEDVTAEGEEKLVEAEAVRKLYKALVAKGSLVNVHEARHRPEGGDRVRKPKGFTLQLDHGCRKDEAKSALVEVLETELRRHARLPCRNAEPLPDLPEGEVAKHFLVYVEPTEAQKQSRKGDKGKDKGKGKGSKGKADKGKGKSKGKGGKDRAKGSKDKDKGDK